MLPFKHRSSWWSAHALVFSGPLNRIISAFVHGGFHPIIMGCNRHDFGNLFHIFQMSIATVFELKCQLTCQEA